jgi:D-aminoacyl-tRNA deacylase
VRAVVQRVSRARVSVEGAEIASIGTGLLILLCAMAADSAAEADALAAKIAKLRIFRDAGDRMNLSVRDAGGAVLVVSQFTLAADLRGNRPGFSTAAAPDIATALCDRFAFALRGLGLSVATGRFGADMAVDLTNDGPVTIWIDTAQKAASGLS